MYVYIFSVSYLECNEIQSLLSNSNNPNKTYENM